VQRQRAQRRWMRTPVKSGGVGVVDLVEVLEFCILSANYTIDRNGGHLRLA
jgi:hypothetical protein